MSVISTVDKNLVATAVSASLGHGWNQSIVQQFTTEGNLRTLFLKASPIGDIDSTICS